MGRYTNYSIKGKEVHGVGLRKLYHDLLAEHSIKGLAVNNPYNGNVDISISGSKSVRSKVLKRLVEKIKNKTGHDIAVEPVKADRLKMHDVVLTPEQLQVANKLDFTAYIRSSKFNPNDPNLQSLDRYKNWAKERYLLKDDGDNLVGKIPDTAYRQLTGVDRPYAWMYNPVRTEEEARAMLKSSAYAKGIKDKHIYGDLKKLKAKNKVRFVLQDHYSARNKRNHYDLRLGDGSIGLYSWAIPKARLPEDKERLLAIRTQLHNYGYNNFTGTIPKGYGAGKVTMADRGMAKVHKTGPRSVEFSVGSKDQPRRYKLVRIKNKTWLIRNTTNVDTKL